MLSGSISFGTTRKTVKIGYFEAGPYYIHKLSLREVKNSLEIIKPDSLELIYEPYAYRSAGWDRAQCRQMASEYLKMNDIDLVLAAGPWVVGDLLEAGYKRPIVGIYQFDPEIAGQVDSAGRPVAKNLTVTYSPDKLKNDLVAMLKLFPASKVGFMYFPEADEFDRYRAKFEGLASELGLKAYGTEKYNDFGVYSFFAAYHDIRDKIDVLYVPPLYGMELDQIRYLFQETQYSSIPTFSAEGLVILEKGATAADAVRPYRSAALFMADKILKIIDGAEPASLPTHFEEARSVCLNLNGAKQMKRIFDRKVVSNAQVIPEEPDESVPRYTLTQALELGERENTGLLALRERYQSVLDEAKKAYMAFVPGLSIGLSAATTDNAARAGIYNDILNREYAADFIVDQKLFSYPAIKAVQAAAKNRESEKMGLKQARHDLRRAITLAYISVLENEERLEIFNTLTSRLHDYWEIAISGNQSGRIDTLDIALIEARLVKTRIKEAEARHELKIARLVFNTLINRPGEETMVLDRSEFLPERMAMLARKLDELTATDDKLKQFERFFIRNGIDSSFTLQQATLAIDRQKDMISINGRGYLPDLNLRLKYSHGGLFQPVTGDRKDSWTFGGYLTIPLLSDPGRHYDRKILKAGLDRLMYEKDTLRFSMVQDISIRADYLVTLVGTLPTAYYSRNLAAANLDSVFTGYQRGDFNIMDLLALEKDASATEFSLIENKCGFFTAYAELLEAIGVDYLPGGSRAERQFMIELESALSGP